MMAISAVPVLATILRDLGLPRTGVGATMLSAAVATDTVGWIPLAAATGLATGGVSAANVAASGLKVDLSQLLDPFLLSIALLVIVVASASKLAGGFLGARLGGMPFWQAAAVGSGLNARGSMQVIAATLALSLGVITGQLYSLIVAMAIVTSMMAPPLIKWTLSRGKAPQEPESHTPAKR